MILSYAAMISAFQEKMETFRWGIMPFGAILLVIIVLLRMEPHNSAIVIITWYRRAPCSFWAASSTVGL